MAREISREPPSSKHAQGNLGTATPVAARSEGPTTNPDGTGSVTLEFTDFEFSVKLAMVITDGGKSIQFADGPGSTGPLALNPALQGSPDRVTGAIPGGFFLQNSRPGAQATGTIPLTMNRTYNDGVAVYSLAAPATGTGSVTCPDGTSGNWSATIPSATAVYEEHVGQFHDAGPGVGLRGRGQFELFRSRQPQFRPERNQSCASIDRLLRRRNRTSHHRRRSQRRLRSPTHRGAVPERQR